MFNVQKEVFGEYTLCKIVNGETGEFFSFFPDFGAAMQQLYLKAKDGVNYPLLYGSDDYQDLITGGRSMYKGSKLFPFANRIRGGSYEFGGKHFQLPINETSRGNALHGLVSESGFKVINEVVSELEGSVELEYFYDKEVEGYPFTARITICFSLDAKGFSCTTTIKNEGLERALVADGWHPYFQLPCSVEDCFLKIPSVQEVELDNHMIPTGTLKYNDYFSNFNRIGNTHFDTCFKLQEEDGIQVVELKAIEKNPIISVWIKSPYSYVQIYTPPPRNCIAIEPMSSMADAFNNKQGLIVLVPGESKEFEWGIKLE